MNTLGVGVDVGGTTIKAVLAGDDGVVRERVDPAPTPHTGAEDVARVVASMAKPLLALAGPGAALGVCVPGIVDEERGMGVFSANLGWRRAPLRDLIAHLCRCPVALGTGIASGLVLGGHLSPSRPWTGEIGQVGVAHPATGVIVPLESVSSASAIARRAVDAGIVPEGAGARDVEDAAVMGSQEAVRILDEAMGALGHVLSVVAHQVGSIPIVLGGGLSRGGELIYGPLRRALTLGSIVAPPPALLRARLGADSQALGAVALSLELEEVYA